MASNKQDKSTQSIQSRLRKAGAVPLRYVTGIGKSIFIGGGKEYISSELPSVTSLYEVNDDFLKDTVVFLKNPAQVVGKKIRSALDSDAYKNVVEIVNNAVDDLKTGNFYDESRSMGRGNSEFGDFGDFGDDMDDFGGFDMSGFDENGDWEESDSDSDDSSSSDASAKLDVEIAKVQEEGAENRTKATVGAIGTAVGAIVENDNVNEQRSLIMRVKHHAQDISAMQNLIVINSAIHESVNNNAKVMVELTREVNTQLINEVKDIKTLITEIRDHTIPKKEEEVRRDQVLPYDLSSGILNIKEYVKGSAKRFYEDSPLSSALAMLGFGGQTMIEILKANPWSFVFGREMFEKLLPEGFTATSQTFNKTLQSFAPAVLSKLHDMGENSDNSDILQLVGKVFGFNPRSSSYVDTSSAYNINEKADFTNKVAKAITDVIPTQLAQIISLIGGERPRLFNYRTGRFDDVGEIVSRHESSLNDLAGRMESTSRLQAIARSALIDAEDPDRRKHIEDYIYKTMQTFAERGGLVDPYRSRQELESILPYGDKEDITMMIGLLQSLPQAQLMSISRDIHSARLSRDRNAFNTNKEMHETSEIMAKSMFGDNDFYDSLGSKSRQTQRGLSVDKIDQVTAEYAEEKFKRFGIKSPSALLRDIRNILAGGIIAFTFNAGDMSNANFNQIMDDTLGSGMTDTISSARKTALKALKHDNSITAKIAQEAEEYRKQEEAAKAKKKEELKIKLADETVEKDSLKNLTDGHDISYITEHFRQVNLKDMTKEELKKDPIYAVLAREKDKATEAMDNVKERTGFNSLVSTIRDVVQEPFKLVETGMKTMDAVMFRLIYGPDAENFLDLDDQDQPYLIKMIGNVLRGDLNSIHSWFDATVGKFADKLFGKEGFFTKLGNKLLDVVSPITTEAVNRVKGGFKAVKEKTVGVRDAAGDFSGGLFSNLINRTGGAYGEYTGSLGKRIEGSVVALLFGNTGTSGKGRVEVFDELEFDESGHLKGVDNHYEYGGVIGMLRKGFDKLNYFLFGDEREDNDSKQKFRMVRDELKETAPNMLIGAGAGALGTAGVGFLTSLWLPGGPLLGAILGSGVGLVTASDKLKNYIFGEFGADGKREGGLIDRDVQDWAKQYLPKTGLGAGVGALLGNFGLLPLGMGPIIGGVFGSMTGMMASSERVKRAIFGEEGDDDSGFLSKNNRKKILSALPTTVLGGVSGNVAWSMISGLGLIPGLSMLPGGPIFTVLGATAGALGADSVKNFLFGEEEEIVDEKTGKTKKIREGGVFGKIFDFGKDKIVTPFFNKVNEAGHAIQGWFEKDVVDPFTSALQPLKDAMRETGDHVKNAFRTVGDKIKESLDNVFEESFGVGLKQFMKEKVFDKLTGLTNKLFNTVGRVIGAVLSAPFKALNWLVRGDTPYYLPPEEDKAKQGKPGNGKKSEDKKDEEKPDKTIQETVKEIAGAKEEKSKKPVYDIDDIEFDENGNLIPIWEDAEEETPKTETVAEKAKEASKEKPAGKSKRAAMWNVRPKSTAERAKEAAANTKHPVPETREKESKTQSTPGVVKPEIIDSVSSDSGTTEEGSGDEEPPQPKTKEQKARERVHNVIENIAKSSKKHQDEESEKSEDTLQSRVKSAHSKKDTPDWRHNLQFFAESANNGISKMSTATFDKIHETLQDMYSEMIHYFDDMLFNVTDIRNLVRYFCEQWSREGGYGGYGGFADDEFFDDEEYDQNGLGSSGQASNGNKKKRKKRKGLKGFLSGIFRGVTSIVTAPFRIFGSAVSGVVKFTSTLASRLEKAAEKIPQMLETAAGAVATAAETIVNSLNGLIRTVGPMVMRVVTGIASGVFGLAEKGIKKLPGVAGKLAGGVGSLVGNAISGGAGLVKNISGGIGKVAGGIGKAVGKVGKAIKKSKAQPVEVVGGELDTVHHALLDFRDGILDFKPVTLFNGKPIIPPARALPVYVVGSNDGVNKIFDKIKPIKGFFGGTFGKSDSTPGSPNPQNSDQQGSEKPNTKSTVKDRASELANRVKNKFASVAERVNPIRESIAVRANQIGELITERSNQIKKKFSGSGVDGILNRGKTDEGKSTKEKVDAYRKAYKDTDTKLERSKNPLEEIDKKISSAKSMDEIAAAKDAAQLNATSGSSEVKVTTDEKKKGLLESLFGEDGIFGNLFGGSLLGKVTKWFKGTATGGKLANAAKIAAPAAAELGGMAANMYNIFGENGNTGWGINNAVRDVSSIGGAVKNLAAGAADDAAKVGPIKNAIAKAINNFLSNGTVQKMFGKLKSKIPALSASLTKFISGTVLEKAMKSGATQAVKSGAKQIAAIASFGLSTAGFFIIDFVSGFGNAKKYFNVFGSDVSLGMRLTSAVVNALGGLLGSIPVVGSFLSVAAAIFQDRIVQLVYNILADDAAKQELAQDQQKLQAATNQYNAENGADLSVDEYAKKFNEDGTEKVGILGKIKAFGSKIFGGSEESSSDDAEKSDNAENWGTGGANKIGQGVPWGMGSASTSTDNVPEIISNNIQLLSDRITNTLAGLPELLGKKITDVILKEPGSWPDAITSKAKEIGSSMINGTMFNPLSSIVGIGSEIGETFISFAKSALKVNDAGPEIFRLIGAGIGDSLVNVIQLESGPSAKKTAVSAVVANVSSSAAISAMNQQVASTKTEAKTPWYKKAANAVGNFFGWGKGGVTPMDQGDSRWARPGDDMKNTGCGPTAAAMVATAYGKRANPAEASQDSYALGMRAPDGGTNPDFFGAYGAEKGIQMQQGPTSARMVNEMTKRGQPVVMMGKGGPFGDNMHYMVADSSDGKGNLNVVDPNGGRRKRVSATEMAKNAKSTIYSSFGKGPDLGMMPKPSSATFGKGPDFSVDTSAIGEGINTVAAAASARQADAFIQIAEAEVGYVEKASNSQLEDKTANAGGNNYTKYGKFAGCNGAPWCAAFVSWCANQAGILNSLIPKFTSCSAGVSWFESKGVWRGKGSGYRPMKGDLIFWKGGDFGSGHVGIVYASDDQYAYTIEGNTTAEGQSGSQNNGGCVAKRKRSLTNSAIRGYAAVAYDGRKTYGVPGASSSGSTSSSGSSFTSGGTNSTGVAAAGGLLGKLGSAYSNMLAPLSALSGAIGGKLASLFSPLTGESSDTTIESNTVMSSNSDGTASDSASSVSGTSAASGIGGIMGAVRNGFNTLNGGGSAYNTYSGLSDAQKTDIATMITGETGGSDPVAAKQEASQLANLTEKSYGQSATPENIIKRLHSGWYAKSSWSRGVTDVAKQAVEDVLVQGRRTLPRYVTEHDMFPGDILSAKDRTAYKFGDAVSNKYGSNYKFYDFFGSKKTGDISGYFESDYNKFKDDVPWGAGPKSDEKIGYNPNEVIRYGKGPSYVSNAVDEYNKKLSQTMEDVDRQTGLENAVNNLTSAVTNAPATQGSDVSNAMVEVLGKMLGVLQTIAENTAKDHVVTVPQESPVQENGTPKVRNVIADSHTTRLNHARDVGAYTIDKMTARV